MLLKQYHNEKLAHSSYILAGEENCAVIDPRRDIQIYLEEAKNLEVKITHILETHLHADFISGHIDLAKKTGAAIYMPESADCQFKHKGLKEGDEIDLEDMQLNVLETPGHTPEHISYVVKDLGRADDAVGVFCGDTLFVGDVGRPDLFPGRAEKLAKKLYDSLFHKLMELPDYCEVYPAHGAGSLCGKAMGAKRRSTIGYEKKYNKVLQITDKDKFIKELTVDMPAAPDHFSRCSAINAKGPVSVDDLPEMKAMHPKEFKEAKAGEVLVVDVRAYDAFGGQFIPGSFNIDFEGNLPTMAGWILPPEVDILVVAENRKRAEETAKYLRRVGLDKVKGYLEGGLSAWSKKGYETEHMQQVSIMELEDSLSDNGVMIDVRSKEKYSEKHIKGAINIPTPELRSKYQELDQDRSYLLYCNTGHRSNLGASILKQHGFSKVFNLAGGMTAYNNLKEE